MRATSYKCQTLRSPRAGALRASAASPPVALPCAASILAFIRSRSKIHSAIVLGIRHPDLFGFLFFEKDFFQCLKTAFLK